MNDPIKEFGIAVRVERARAGLTQAELAEKLHTTNRTVSKVETAQTIPRLDTVATFAHGLNISLDAILLESPPGKDRIPYCVRDFFADMSEEQAQKYIGLCRQGDDLHKANK